ncbi:MAG: diguanylate cyclase [Burkholderiales bacterium]|nr:diguanylate cyclase [Burkholderiales bacterium]
MEQTQNKLSATDRRPRILAILSQVVEADLDLAAFMQLVVDTLQEFTRARGVVVELVEGNEMVYRAASAPIAEHVGLRLPRHGSFSGLCVDEAKVLRCDDAETDSRVNREACRKVGVRSMLCAPLFQEGRPIGVLKVMSVEANGFCEQDVYDIESMSAVLGAALGKQVVFDRLERAERRLRTILEHANDAVISVDQHARIIQWNNAAERLFGWRFDEAIGRDAIDLLIPVHQREPLRKMLEEASHTFNVPAAGGRQEVQALHRTGGEMTLECSLNVLQLDNCVELTAFLHDISARKQLERALRELAQTDALTGLANRRQFTDLLHLAVARSHRSHVPLALFYMDLNGFKQINDTLGHDVGDQALCEFAKRLGRCVRETDVIARLGGDEFTLLAEGIQDHQQAELLAHKIIATLQAPLPGTDIYLATSIGISLYDGRIDAQSYLRQADAAMFAAKRQPNSRSRLAFHSG